jgi:hypothetical protein
MSTRALVTAGALLIAACSGSTAPTNVPPPSAMPAVVVVHAPAGRIVPASSYPGELPVFEQRFVGDGGALEPDLDFAANGDVLYFAWTYGGLANDQKFNVIWKTADGGRTWRDVTPPLLTGASAVGDPIVYRDAPSGRVYVAGHNNYMPIQWTEDGGESWTTAPPVVAGGVTDYPVLWSVPAANLPTVDHPSVLYLCVFTTIEYECHASLDGGLTWPPINSPFPARTSFTINCVPSTGRVAGSPSDTTLYMPFVLAPDAGEPSGYVACADPTAPVPAWGQWVGVSHDQGLTWELRFVAGLGGYGDLRLAVDAAGNAYFLMVGEDSKPYLSISRDRGMTWSAPVDVAAPGVTAVNQVSLAAGDEGRIGLFYIGTSIPGGATASEDPTTNAAWFPYMSISLDALSAEPVFATAVVGNAADPVRRGPCLGRCLIEDGECVIDCSVGGPTKGMRDYSNTKANPVDGMIWTAYVDLCTGDCAVGSGPAALEPSFRAAVGIQTMGTPITAHQ